MFNKKCGKCFVFGYVTFKFKIVLSFGNSLELKLVSLDSNTFKDYKIIYNILNDYNS